MAANKRTIPLTIPDPLPEVKQWLILGIDPSMSRSGFALMRVRPESGGTKATWLQVGSVKPESSADPIWIRGKMMSLHLRKLVDSVTTDIQGNDLTAWNGLSTDHTTPALGLIISMEYPTPMNDFLVALNRILHLVFFETNLWERFTTVRVLTTNAATLRSLMNLTKKGAKNKSENIDKAYEFLDKTAYPKLDTDACDAVLLSMMARHTASILMGHPEEVPEKYLVALCNANQEMKGKGRNAKIITKGILHRREYFYSYKRNTYTLVVNDASRQTNKLERTGYSI
jgi:hypothetical protein